MATSTDGVRQCIEDAVEVNTLDLLERMMHVYKANNVAAFRKRVLALADIAFEHIMKEEQVFLEQTLECQTLNALS